MGEIQDTGLNRKIQDASAITKDADALDAEIAELKNAYEQFFLGIERKPPTLEHQALKKKIFKLKGAFVRQTALKFRINALQQKFTSYERLWARTLQEIEDGTYRRDLVKAKLHQKEREEAKAREKEKEKAKGEKAKAAADSLDAALNEDVDFNADLEVAAPPPPSKPPSAPAIAAKPTSSSSVPAIAKPATGSVPAVKPGSGSFAAAKPATGSAPAVKPGSGSFAAARPATGSVPAAKPAAPGAPARPPSGSSPAVPRPAAASGDNLSDAKLKVVYDAYVTAKKRCQEDTSKLSFESVAANLRKQVPELMKKSGAQGVEFKIVIKDGKAVLRAIPK